MKRIAILLYLCFWGAILKSQDFKLTYSDLQERTNKTQIVNVGKVGNNIIQIQVDDYQGEEMSMYIYDARNMSLIKKKDFKKTTCKTKDCIDRHFGFVQVLFFKDEFILFFQTFERSSKTKMLFAQRVNKDGDFTGDFTQIDAIESNENNDLFSKLLDSGSARKGSFMLWISEDSTKFVSINNPPFEKYRNEKFGFKVYNKSLKNISNTSISLPYKDKNLSVVDYYLGNDGNIFMLVKVELDKKGKIKGQAPYYYSILTVNSNNNSISETKVNLPSKNIANIVFKLDKECKKILCSGFYSELKPKEYEGEDIDGVFYITIDALTQNIDSKGFKKIDKEVVAAILDKKKVKDGVGIDKSFQIVYFNKRSDGTANIVAENRFIIQKSSNRGAYYVYHYTNIFVINIDKDGSILSFINIPKNQILDEINKLSGSLIPFEKDNKLFLIYNDNPKNLDPKVKTFDDAYLMNGYMNTCMVAAEINKDGSCTKKKIQDYKNSPLYVLPIYSFRSANGEYIVPILESNTSACSCFIVGLSKQRIGFAKISL